MALTDQLQLRLNAPFAPEDPFSGLQAGRTPEEEAFDRNRIAARGQAFRQGAAGRIRQRFARLGGAPRGAEQKAITQSNLGAAALTSDALAQDQVAAEAARRQREFDLAGASAQFGFGVERANLGRLGQGLDLARLAEGARQFDVSGTRSDVDRDLALRRQQIMDDIEADRLAFQREKFTEGLRREDAQTLRGNRLQDQAIARDLEDRRALLEELTGEVGPGLMSSAGIGGAQAGSRLPAISRRFGGF